MRARNFLSSSFAGAALMACLVLFSCDRSPEATMQVQGRVEAPAFPNLEARFGLAGDLKTVRYDGSVLIWNQSVGAPEMAEVSDASKDNRELKSQLNMYRRERLLPAEAEEKRLHAEGDRLRAEAGTDPSVIATQRVNARRWFADQTADVQARQVFAKYCEAKIWDLASFGEFAARKFRARPTPLELCEDVYAEKGFFDPASAECSAPAEGESKRYFDCLWTQGVMKTSFYVGRYDVEFPGAAGAHPFKNEKLVEWIQGGILSAALQQADQLARSNARNAVMGQRASRPTTFNVNGANNLRFRDVFVPRGGSPTNVSTSPLDGMSPQFVIDQVESLSLSVSAIAPAALLIPGAATDAAQGEALQKLRKSLGDMATRTYPGAASVSDFIYNHSDPAVSEPSTYDLVRVSPEFSGIFQALSPEFKARLDANDETLNAQKKLVAAQKAEAAKLAEKWSDSLRRGVNAVAKPGVAIAFWTKTQLTMQQSGDVMTVEYHLDVGPAFEFVKSCYDVKAKIQVPCARNTESALVLEAPLKIEVEKSKIVLDIALENPEAFGLAQKLGGTSLDERASGFNDIDPASLKGKTWRLELYGNELPGLPFLTGKALILDGEKVVHEGATSLMPYQ